MWSRIVKMSPVVLKSYMNYLGYGKRWALHLWLRLSAWLAPR